MAQFDRIIEQPGVKTEGAHVCWPGVAAAGTSGRIGSEHRGNNVSVDRHSGSCVGASRGIHLRIAFEAAMTWRKLVSRGRAGLCQA